MLTKCTYFMYMEPRALHRPRHEDKQKVIYFWHDGEHLTDRIVTNTGSLSSIKNISSEDIDYWKISVGGKNQVKFFDYLAIKIGLEVFAKEIKLYGKKHNLEYLAFNCDKERENQGYSKLRPFEEEIFRKALGLRK